MSGGVAITDELLGEAVEVDEVLVLYLAGHEFVVHAFEEDLHGLCEDDVGELDAFLLDVLEGVLVLKGWVLPQIVKQRLNEDINLHQHLMTRTPSPQHHMSIKQILSKKVNLSPCLQLELMPMIRLPIRLEHELTRREGKNKLQTLVQVV